MGLLAAKASWKRDGYEMMRAERDQERTQANEVRERQRSAKLYPNRIQPGDEISNRRRMCQILHARTRLWQRYGIEVPYVVLDSISHRMSDTLTKPGILYLGAPINDSGSTQVWLILVDDQFVPVVYNGLTKAIVTVLPMDAAVIKMERGRFVALANGGSMAGCRFWSETML